jgi:transposase
MRFITLSLAEEQQLTALHTSSNNAVERRRSQCLLLSARGHTITQLTAIFAVCCLTVSHWFDGWESVQLAGLRHRPGQCRKRKLAAVPRPDLEALVREHPQNLQAMLAEVETTHAIQCSKGALCRQLKNLGVAV